MDQDKLWDKLEALEWIIGKLEEVRWMDREIEVEPLLGDLKNEAEDVREEINRLGELEYDALCREYERNAL